MIGIYLVSFDLGDPSFSSRSGSGWIAETFICINSAPWSRAGGARIRAGPWRMIHAAPSSALSSEDQSGWVPVLQCPVRSYERGGPRPSALLWNSSKRKSEVHGETPRTPGHHGWAQSNGLRGILRLRSGSSTIFLHRELVHSVWYQNHSAHDPQRL